MVSPANGLHLATSCFYCEKFRLVDLERLDQEFVDVGGPDVAMPALRLLDDPVTFDQVLRIRVRELVSGLAARSSLEERTRQQAIR